MTDSDTDVAVHIARYASTMHSYGGKYIMSYDHDAIIKAYPDTFFKGWCKN